MCLHAARRQPALAVEFDILRAKAELHWPRRNFVSIVTREALAADEMIADVLLAEGHFERAGLLIGAEENRLIAPGNAASDASKLDFFDNGLRFLFVGVRAAIGPRTQARGPARCPDLPLRHSQARRRGLRTELQRGL